MKTKLCSSALWFLGKAFHIVLQQLSCTNPKVFVAVPILVFRIYDESRCHSKGLQQTVVFFDSTVCLLILPQKCCTVSKKNKKLCVFLDSTVFLLIFLQKCCTVPKKPILFCKSAVLYQKNQKNQFFQVLGPRSAICLSIRLVFLRQYSTFTKKDWFFLGQYSVFVNFLAKVLYCPKKKPIFFCKSAVLSQKNQKKHNLFQSCCPARSQDLKRLVFWFFWDSTAL